MDNKKKIAIVKLIIIIVNIIIFILVGILFNLYTIDRKINKTTTTIKSESIVKSDSKPLSTSTSDETVSITTTNLITISKITTKTTSRITTKTTTSHIVTKTITTTKNSIVDSNRNIVTSDSLTPGINNEFVWTIFNRINDKRQNNGLNKLLMDYDLRNLAEEAADLYSGTNDDELHQYLYGKNHYAIADNSLSSNGYIELYNKTITRTQILNNSYYKYVGIAVLEKEHGISGIHTYYYVIIYE